MFWLPSLSYKSLLRAQLPPAPVADTMIWQLVTCTVAAAVCVGAASYAVVDGVVSDFTTHQKIKDAAADEDVKPAWTKG